MNLMQRRVDVLFSSKQLRKGDISKSVVDNLMKLDDNGSDSAISSMNAAIENTRVALTM